MRLDAVIAGVGMTPFGKHIDKGLKALGAEATRAALADAGIEQDAIQAAYVGNAAAGLVTGQESIRGQVILRSIGLGRLPVVNVENACASASTALHQAAAMVSAGLYDVVLALGVEKLYHADKKKSFAAFSGAVDVEAMQEIMKRLQEAARLKPFSPHDGRRFYITALLANGNSITVVQKLAGHASVNTTARYDRSDEDAKRKAAETLHLPFSR